MAPAKRFTVLLMLGSMLNLLPPIPDAVSSVQAQTSVIPVTQRTIGRAKPIDISLNANDMLLGKVVNSRGAAVLGTNVKIYQDANLVTAVRTDRLGMFALGPIQGGAYQLVTTNEKVNVRVWTSKAAPPTAKQRVLFAEGTVVRGQQCSSVECEIVGCDGSCGNGTLRGGPFGMLFHPLFIGAAVVAAIAIPLALDDDDDDAS